MLARLSTYAPALAPVLVLTGSLALGFATPSMAQDQEGDQALVDTASEPAIAEPIIQNAGKSDLVPPDPLAAAIFLRIEYDEGDLSGGGADARMLDLYEFYDGRLYEPVWINETGATQKAIDMANALLLAETHGLDPNDYDTAIITTLIKSRSSQGLADLEIRLSKAMLDYGRDLSVGRVEPSSIAKDLAIYPEGPAAAELLLGIATSDSVADYLASLAPRSDNYKRLKSTLEAYRAIAAHGGWHRVPAGDVLKPGMAQARVAQLGDRMMDAGLITPTELPQAGAAGELPVYDGAIVGAVKTFQARHGLEVDGIVGPGTLAALNTSIEERIATMELNMERRRWMDDDLGRSYVFVNLADYELKVVRDQKTVHTARVVIGKTYHRTPVFSEEMTYIVLNPYWNVPASIAKNELLPKLVSNPGAMKAQNIRILNGWKENAAEIDPWSVNWASYKGRRLPFRMRQDPGSKNALGRIKFMFPNRFNVYLHDTPSKSLFARTVRNFSHGCVRVQHPVNLAEVLLAEDPNWSPDRIQSTLNQKRKRIVKLASPIPVHVTYLTAWVNKDGSVHFRDDVYSRDKALSEALQRNSQSI